MVSYKLFRCIGTTTIVPMTPKSINPLDNVFFFRVYILKCLKEIINLNDRRRKTSCEILLTSEIKFIVKNFLEYFIASSIHLLLRCS